jgi:methionyl-tRNA formyltransferase
MFDTIILLTGPVEETALTSVLRHHNPQLDIRAVESLAEMESFGPALLSRARLIGFVTPVIVPLRILERLGFGAYNFHPGPPQYPGWVPSHFAIYDRVKYFGATAHLMIERVDAGPIVGVEMFGVAPDTSVMACKQS